MLFRILDQDGKEVAEEEVDTSKGKLEQEEIVVAFHDAVEAVPERSHLYPSKVYFGVCVDEDGESYYPEAVEVEDGDERIKVVDDNFYWHDDSMNVFGMDLKTIVDEEEVVAQEAWEEKETILRYTPYTAEELVEIGQEAALRQKKEALVDAVDALQKSTSTIAATISSIQAEIADTKTETDLIKDELSSAISPLQEEVSNIGRDTLRVQESLTNVASAVSAIQSENTNARLEIDSTKAELTFATSSINEEIFNIKRDASIAQANIQEKIDPIQSDLSTAMSEIANTQGEVDKVNCKVDEKFEAIDYLTIALAEMAGA